MNSQGKSYFRGFFVSLKGMLASFTSRERQLKGCTVIDYCQTFRTGVKDCSLSSLSSSFELMENIILFLCDLLDFSWSLKRGFYKWVCLSSLGWTHSFQDLVLVTSTSSKGNMAKQRYVLEVVIQKKKYFQLQSFLVEVCLNLQLCRCQIPFKSN